MEKIDFAVIFWREITLMNEINYACSVVSLLRNILLISTRKVISCMFSDFSVCLLGQKKR